MNLGKIKKIYNLGRFDNDSWVNGELIVVFEDKSAMPIVVKNKEDKYKVFEEYARQNGIDEDLDKVIYSMGDALSIVDRNNPKEYADMKAEVDEAIKSADEAQKKQNNGTAIPVGGVLGSNPGQAPSYGEMPDDEELEEEIKGKKHTGAAVAAGVLAGASAAAAGATVYSMIKDHNVDQYSYKEENNENVQDQNIDFNTATFDELMNAMNDNDARKIVSQNAMALVQKFHDETHKEGNFRLEEDGQSYLDLSYEEALVLVTFANYSSADELYEILGDYNLTSEHAQDLLESARTKFITYYMNAVESSGLAEIFNSEKDSEFFKTFENSVIKFNKNHDTASSDEVIRLAYYNYIKDSAANNTAVGSLAKLLSFDTIYGGLNLVESASVEHSKFLEFHGNSAEEETKYYVEEVLNLNYDSLTKEEKDTYRKDIIESGTKLMEIVVDGSKDSQKDDEIKSVTELVDQLGLCNSANNDISEKINSLSTMSAVKSATLQVQYSTLNSSVASNLRKAGYDELANKVNASLSSIISDELLSEIRSAGSDAFNVVENYKEQVSLIDGSARPTINQIINAANDVINLELENYVGATNDLATLINNRRHTVLQKDNNSQYQKDGLLGHDENNIPVYDKSVLDGKTQEEIDDFIIQNGAPIDNNGEKEKTETVTEEVRWEDLTSKEKEEVQQQIVEQGLLSDPYQDANNAGQKVAREKADNSTSFYTFPTNQVVDPIANGGQGESYYLNSMAFDSAVYYYYLFGGANIDDNPVISINDSQIQNAAEVDAENYVNSISASDQELIAKSLNTSWSSARLAIKEAYKSGYLNVIENTITNAIESAESSKVVIKNTLDELERLNSDNSNSQQLIDENLTPEYNENNLEDVQSQTTGEGNNNNNSDNTNDDWLDDPNLNPELGPGEQPYQEGTNGNEEIYNNEINFEDGQVSPEEENNNNNNTNDNTNDDWLDDPNLNPELGQGEQSYQSLALDSERSYSDTESREDGQMSPEENNNNTNDNTNDDWHDDPNLNSELDQREQPYQGENISNYSVPQQENVEFKADDDLDNNYHLKSELVGKEEPSSGKIMEGPITLEEAEKIVIPGNNDVIPVPAPIKPVLETESIQEPSYDNLITQLYEQNYGSINENEVSNDVGAKVR